MSIVDDVSARLKFAMKAREIETVRALRLIRAAMLTKMKEDNSSNLPDEAAVAVLRKLAKMRVEVCIASNFGSCQLGFTILGLQQSFSDGSCALTLSSAC
jgi:uncharacterized protein YqeY